MSLKGKRVFIVEDNSMNRVVYQVVLRKQGVVLEFDRWGRDSIERLQRFGEVDLIILDLMLPNGDSGDQIFEKIRTLPEYAEVPIIAISASEPSIAIPTCQQLGFSGFIAKPIDDLLLPKQIKQLLQGESVWHAGERF